jgi:hypothetical protein
MTIELNQWRDDPRGVAKTIASEDLKAGRRLWEELGMAIHLAEHPDIDEWLAVRKREALLIDPETAEWIGGHGEVMDPYGVYGRYLPDEVRCYGSTNFARRPGSDIWVVFYDLPEATVKRLWERAGNGDFDKSNGDDEFPF